jgi:long-chain acyl-CoA synthetase
MAKRWLKQYPAGVPGEVEAEAWPSLVALLDESLHTHRERNA